MKSSFSILIFALMLLVGSTYMNAWTAPNSNPPSDNVAAPINTASGVQYKEGTFGANYIHSFTRLTTDGFIRSATEMRSPLYCDVDGNNCISADQFGSGGGGSALLPGWPDVITCNDGTRDNFLYLSMDYDGGNVVYGRPGVANQRQVLFDRDTRNFVTNDGLTNNPGCTRDMSEYIAAGDVYYLAGGAGGALPTCAEGDIVVSRGGNWVCEGYPQFQQIDRVWSESDGWRVTSHGRHTRNRTMTDFLVSDAVDYYTLTADTAIGCEQRGCSRMQNDPRIFCYPQYNRNGSWTTIGPVVNDRAAGSGYAVRTAGGTHYFKPAPAGLPWFQRIASPSPTAAEIGAPIRIVEDNFLRLSAGDGDDYNCNYSFEFERGSF